MKDVILASSSPYRQQLIARLGISARCIPPAIDETPQHDETAEALSARLAKEKAQAILATHTFKRESLILGSDQTASIEGQPQLILGKPLYHEKAHQQLTLCSGKTVTFYTSLCVINTYTQNIQLATTPFSVTFRHLNSQHIETYLNIEQPYDCAGSFKCEGLGITLFEHMTGSDPNALIGLPLISLCDMLINENCYPLDCYPPDKI